MTDANIIAARDEIHRAESLLKAAKKRLDELKEEPSKPWPQKGDKYWFIDGEVTVSYTWDNDGIDKGRLAIGLVFRTEEEAEQRLLRLRAEQKLRVARGDWVPNWSFRSQQKWYNYYDHGKSVWGCAADNLFQLPGVIYFPYKQAALYALATLTDEERDALKGGG